MRKKSSKCTITLRPHHVIGYFDHMHHDLTRMTNSEYIAEFRKHKGDFHSDQLIIHWFKTMKELIKNPDLRFKYVKGMDSVCERCEHKMNCHDTRHESYRIVEQADRDARKQLSELRFGRIYDGHFLKELFKKGVG